MNVERLDLTEWKKALPSDGFEVFHTPEALSVLEAHAPDSCELWLLGGFNGQQAVALLPLFVQTSPVGTVIRSPLPSFDVPRLGPVLMPTSPKRRKQEKVNREFVRGVLDVTGADARYTLLYMQCNATYLDPRPFLWADFNVEMKFTYRLDCTMSPDGVLETFSKSLRREIRNGRESDVTIGIEGLDGARAIYEATRARYEEQGNGFGKTWEYVRDVVDALGERCRVYVARTATGEYLSGVIVLYSNDAAYYWQGGARTTHDGMSVNSLLHWRIIEDIIEDPAIESVTQYDLMGGNMPRLNRYKSKFNAELVPYYVIESSGIGMAAAKRIYQTVFR